MVNRGRLPMPYYKFFAYPCIIDTQLTSAKDSETLTLMLIFIIDFGDDQNAFSRWLTFLRSPLPSLALPAKANATAAVGGQSSG